MAQSTLVNSRIKERARVPVCDLAGLLWVRRALPALPNSHHPRLRKRGGNLGLMPCVRALQWARPWEDSREGMLSFAHSGSGPEDSCGAGELR